MPSKPLVSIDGGRPAAGPPRPEPDEPTWRPSGSVLIIGSSGGGAHRSASEALAERLAADRRVEGIAQVDLLVDWLGPAGRLFAGVWNRAMRAGHARELGGMLRLQRACDLLFYLPILFAAVRAMRRGRVDCVLDCQPLGTRSILGAARWATRFRGVPVRVTKVLTEPTHRRLPQYFKPILRLPPRLRRDLHVWASPPLLEPRESTERFWQERCGIPSGQVEDRLGFPVRPPFDLPAESGPLVLRLEEREARRAQGDFPLRPVAAGRWAIDLPQGARVVAIVMGSQSTRVFTLESVRRILDRLDDPELYLFVYAVDPRLRRELSALGRRTRSRTKVLAMPFQDAAALASLYRRSNATLTRSGGMTCMELLTSARGPALVCSGRRSGGRFGGMVEHEYGNFLYLARFHPAGARLVATRDVADHLAEVLANPTADAASAEARAHGAVAGTGH